MFNGAAFPRIPSFSQPQPEKKKSTTSPPAIPFDTLIVASDVCKSTTMKSFLSVDKCQKCQSIIQHYAEVLPTIETDDAKTFLTALAFLATRNTQPPQ